MSLGSNTLTITIDSTPLVLKRINQDNFGSQYYLHNTTEEYTVNIRHTKEGMQQSGVQFDRHNVELIHTVFPTDTAPGKSRVLYIVVRNTRNDDYDAIEDTYDGFVGLLSDSIITDLLSWVS